MKSRRVSWSQVMTCPSQDGLVQAQHLLSLLKCNSLSSVMLAGLLLICLFCSCILQLIQTVSAVDQDDPQEGQHFYYSLAPEAANNPNFTLRDNQGNQSGRGQLVTLISIARVGQERVGLAVSYETAISNNAQ